MKLTLRESGAFYITYNNDAKIIHKLFGYKMVKGRIGFPKEKINTVMSMLRDKKIDFIVYDKNEVDIYSASFEDNQYEKFLIQAEKTFLMDNRINGILLRLKDEDEDRLNDLITLIGDFLDAEKGEGTGINHQD